MTISKLYLANFRNFNEKLFSFSKAITLIVGDNATGKTNILESINLLATGKSFKAKVEEEMITYDEEIGRVKGLISENGMQEVGPDSGEVSGIEKTHNSKHTTHNVPHTIKLEVVLTRGEITVGTSAESVQKTAKKKLLVNGVSRRLLDFSGNLKTVVFSPQDLELVTESPSIRRKFLDSVLSLVDREYRRASLSYDKGLRQRNRLLLRIREEGLPRSQLMFWDRLLIKNGDYIARCREEFIDYVNNTNFQFPISDFQIEYDKSVISEARLEQYASEEVAVATTLVGPHRDDFIMKSITGVKSTKSVKGRELARFGSRGEQRMGVLWLKLAELSYVEERSQDKPVLLLDDIFSELDHEHRDLVMKAAKGQQTIITTADPHFVDNKKKINVINI
jgi:DNA replication and repair protein RecF